MQCSSVGCGLAQGKDIRPLRPEFGPEGKHFVSGNSLFFKFLVEQRSCDGRGRAASVWRVYEPKKTGARSARARTRGQNLLVYHIFYLGYFVCVSVIHNCGTLCYSFSFNNQTDQRDETEGLKREGLEGER